MAGAGVVYPFRDVSRVYLANAEINPIIFAEVSMKFTRIEDADAALTDFARDRLPTRDGARYRTYFPGLTLIAP
jgi:hypothetical protein